MSSFPKHSFEQAYDHAFPPSPPQHHVSALPTVSERSPLITKAPVPHNNINGKPKFLHPGTSYTSSDSISSYVTAPTTTSPPVLPSSLLPSPRLQETDTLLENGVIAGGDLPPNGIRRVSSSTLSDDLSLRELTLREFKILLGYSGPVVLTYVLQNSLQLASLISLGHLGSI
ncbi:hypothetical protein EDD11_002900, partial [Mortierella claussenii]